MKVSEKPSCLVINNWSSTWRLTLHHPPPVDDMQCVSTQPHHIVLITTHTLTTVTLTCNLTGQLKEQW